MDYHSYDSDVIESLNLLRPPAKRGGISESELGPKNIQVLNLTSNCGSRLSEAKNEGSSTSLVLEKTSKTQILKQYSVVSYPNAQYPLSHYSKSKFNCERRDKPLIKVTVIPRNCNNTDSKVLRKRRFVTKTIQETSSDHNNSIQTKNLFLVVAGRKEDKIYEIKTTGSAKFDRVRDDKVEVRRQIFQNFSMERKKKKAKKETKINKLKDEKEADNVAHVCRCCPGDGFHDAELNLAKPGKSRVKIFGKLGVMQNDKYVLKCHATVDDKPVSTFMADKQFSYESVTENNQDTAANSKDPRICGVACVRGGNRDPQASAQTDTLIQADFRLKAVNDLLLNIENQYKIRKESQSTQVDLTVAPNRYTQQPVCMHTRCSCNPEYSKIDPTHEDKNLKECQSPLVIISVFPKQDNNLKFDFLKAVQEEQAERFNYMTTEYNRNIPNEFDRNTTPEFRNFTSEFNRHISPHYSTLNAEVAPVVPTKNKSRSRSPSPKKRSPSPKSPKSPKTKPKEVNEFRQGRAKVKEKHSKADQNTSANQTLQFYNSQMSDDGKRISNLRTKSPEKQNKSKDTPEKHNKTKVSPVKIHKTTSPKPKTKRKVDIGINTEHLQTKKALVDSYTKVMLEQSNKDKPPRLSISKVSVNIDSGNELFDLSYQQGGFTTDLNIRKTKKEVAVSQTDDDNRDRRDDSMENLFPCYQSGKTIVCQSVCENPSKEIIIEEGNNRRLTLRDSLEISHRREDKVPKIDQRSPPRKHKKAIQVEDEIDYSAPVKHFTGDSCVVCDPIARDKEIRRLLGVPRITESNTHRTDPPGAPISRCCLYPRKCNKTLTTAIAIPNERHHSKQYYKLCQDTKGNDPNQVRFYKSNLGDQVVRCYQDIHGIRAVRGIQDDRGIQDVRGIQDDRGIEGNRDDRGLQSGRVVPGEASQGDRGIQIDRSNQDVRRNQIGCGPCACKPSLRMIEAQHIYADAGRIYSDTDSSIKFYDRAPQEKRQSPAKISFQEPSPLSPAYQETNCQTDAIEKNPFLKDASVPRPEFPIMNSRSSPHKDAYATQFVGKIPESCNCRPSDMIEITPAVVIQKANQANEAFNTNTKDCVCAAKPPHPALMYDASTTYEGFSPERSTRKRHRRRECKRDKCIDSKDVKYKEEREETKAKQSKTARDRGCKAQPISCSKESSKDNTEEKIVPQQLTLNRNVQVFLQMEQFSKQKPIVLSRKQYKKVKKTIQRTLSARDKPGIKDGNGKIYCKCKHSLLSSEEIKEKQKSCSRIYFHQEVQTERVQTCVNFFYEQPNRERLFGTNPDTIVLFSNEDRCARDSSPKDKAPKDKVPCSRLVSSVEMRYASGAPRKEEPFSTTNVASVDNLSFPRRINDSFETIFRGHRKSLTPNLGTSALSLQSEANISKSQSLMVLPDAKTKKPFLRRLISCLVMKSRTSDVAESVHPPTSKNSSVDSYHISTSFGAIEMSSSLYDTSASFYSDHGIHPLNSKLKRSFFSSVRGFLASRPKS